MTKFGAAFVIRASSFLRHLNFAIRHSLQRSSVRSAQHATSPQLPCLPTPIFHRGGRSPAGNLISQKSALALTLAQARR